MADKVIQRYDQVDVKFDKAKSDNYHLLVQYGQDYLNYAVFDPKQKEFLLLKAFTFQDATTIEIFLSGLQQINRQESLWDLPFARVSTFIESPKFTFVPDEVFQQGKILDYARLSINETADDSIFLDSIASQQCKNVFLISSKIVNEFKQIFKVCDFHHAYSSLIETLAGEHNSVDKKIFVLLHDNAMVVVVLHGSKLLFCNYFAFRSGEDFIYFILSVCEQLNLNPETIPMVLMGDIERNSAIFNYANKYIRDVGIGRRPRRFHYVSSLDAIPQQYFSGLFACAS